MAKDLPKSTLSAWIKAICDALQAAGCDSAALLEAAGVNPKILDKPRARCPMPQAMQMWRIAVVASGDPAFGLKVASHIKDTTFYALSHGIAASSTLQEAFERATRYSHVVSDAVEYRFERSGGEYFFEVAPTADLGDEQVDAIVGSYLRMCRSLIGRDYSPLRIEFRRPPPRKLEDFKQLLRSPLLFDAPRTRLIFDSDSMERLLPKGNPKLARHNDAIAMQYLSRLERENTQLRVRELLTRSLARGEPSQEEISEMLNMSPRTLQRKLADDGITFNEVLDQTRQALAFEYLKTLRYTISDVTYLLGFSAGSCFTRAFRRWTGITPSAWRTQRSWAEAVPSDVSTSLTRAIKRGRTFSSRNSSETM